MKKLTSILAGVTVAGLVSAAAMTSLTTADAAQPGSSANRSGAFGRDYNTKVKFLNFDHTRGFGTKTHIRGQVIAPSLHGAVPGVRVRLYRKLNGSSTWHYLDTDYTSRDSRPVFRFDVRSIARADYRVVYRGNDRFNPSRNSTEVGVYRHFDAKLNDGTGRFHGRATPHYAHEVIYLDKRQCASCGWHHARKARTGDHGRWSFKVHAPSSGRWWWRVSTPASTHFIRSHSAVFSTALA